AEVLNVFARAPQRGGRLVAMLGQLLVDGFDVALGPADGGNFDLAARSDVENRGHVGQAVSIRHRVLRRIVERDGKSDAVFAQEILGVARLVLRDAEYGDVGSSIRLVHALQKRKSILANRAAHLEEHQHNRTVGERLPQRHLSALHSRQREIWSEYARV